MSTIEIKINTDNEVFQNGNLYDEVLRAIKETICRGSEIIKDLNGNTIGYIRETKEDTINIPRSLYKDLNHVLNQITNTKVSGLNHGNCSYDIVSVLEKIGR